MNVDRLIVVDVGYPLTARKGLGSVTNVANQMLTILIRRESEKQLATLTASDVLVSPDMDGVSSYNFTKLRQIMSAGSAAAAQVRDQLQALAVPVQQYEQYLASRARQAQEPVIRSVAVSSPICVPSRSLAESSDFSSSTSSSPRTLE